MFTNVSYRFSKYNRVKNITIYVPDDASEEKRYPVLYINDGQNAFFDENSYMGVSWGFYDYVKEHGDCCIMVAIDCVFDEIGRMDEYGPWKVKRSIRKKLHIKEKTGGQGDDYVKWIINELKPFIDDNYPTIKHDCAMVGSSMGGVITAYACFAYPKVFKKGAALSTAFFIYPHEFKRLLKRADLSSSTFYFDCGDEEGHEDSQMSQIYIESQDAIRSQLKNKEGNFEYHFFTHTTHNEEAWRKRVPLFMHFLFEEDHHV